MLLFARLSYVGYHFIQKGISISKVYQRKWNVFNILRSNYTLSRITQIRFCKPMQWNAQRHCTLCPLYAIRLDKTALSSISWNDKSNFFWFLRVWILFTQWFLTKTKSLCWSKAYFVFILKMGSLIVKLVSCCKMHYCSRINVLSFVYFCFSCHKFYFFFKSWLWVLIVVTSNLVHRCLHNLRYSNNNLLLR